MRCDCGYDFPAGEMLEDLLALARLGVRDSYIDAAYIRHSSESFIEKLFDPSGRFGRLEFLAAWLLSNVLVFVFIGLYTLIVSYIRRWHDLGHSGWSTLALLVPFVNIAVLLYLFLAPGIPDIEEA